MKIAAALLGIVGGLAGTYISLILGMGLAWSAADDSSIIGPFLFYSGLLASILSILGIVGGAISFYSSKLAGIIMLISGICSILITAMGLFVSKTRLDSNLTPLVIVFTFATLCISIGGILALRVARKQTIISVVTPTQTLS